MQASATVDRYEPASVPTGRLGMWWVLGSELVIFGGAIVIYLLYRLRNPEWAAESLHTNEIVGLINTVILLTSSLTMALAHRAAALEQGRRAANLLGLTLLLGLAFLGLKAFEYSGEIAEGFTPTTDLFWSFYYFLTGLHALHIVAGLIAIAAVRRGAKKGLNLQRVDYVGLYWHLVDVIWIFLFPILYLAGRP